MPLHLVKLSVGADGKTLLANVWIEDAGAPGSGVYSRSYQSLLRWDVAALLRAALKSTDVTVPVDLIKSGSHGLQRGNALRVKLFVVTHVDQRAAPCRPDD